MGSPWVSHHARQRMAERHGGNPEAAAYNAWHKGFSRSQKRGALRQYLDYLWDKNGRSAELKLYDGYVWVFKDGGLVTVYEVDYKFARAVVRKNRKKEKGNG